MINASTTPNEYRKMLQDLDNDSFLEISKVVIAKYFDAIEDDDILDEEFNHLFYAQSLIEDEKVRRSGENDKVGFIFNPLGV